jgi:tripartite-type tricarboxylate transporter receptor subunit TctC
VHPSTPAKNIKELVALAKARPGELTFASPGVGSTNQLAGEMFKLATGIDIVHVPYKGASGALQDAVGGHVQATIAAVQTAHPSVQSGKLRALAIMSAERSPAYPDVPTMKEQGLSELEVETWYGAFAPAGTPASAIRKINSDIDASLKDPSVRAVLGKQGMTPRGGPPERLGDLVARELPRWARVVKAAGIKAD